MKVAVVPIVHVFLPGRSVREPGNSCAVTREGAAGSGGTRGRRVAETPEDVDSLVINCEARKQRIPSSMISHPKLGSMLPQAERCHP